MAIELPVKSPLLQPQEATVWCTNKDLHPTQEVGYRTGN